MILVILGLIVYCCVCYWIKKDSYWVDHNGKMISNKDKKHLERMDKQYD